jgi:outer membrane protein insertion porin family
LVGWGLGYNTLDNVRDPSRGFLMTLNQDFAGLGGDAHFLKTIAEARYYQPIMNDLTGMLKVSGGYVTGWGGGNLLVLDHFFQGPGIVRGFQPAGIGPRDLSTAQRDALGGSLFWGATAELQFPLPFVPKEIGIKGALFADAGSLWNYTGLTTFSSSTLPAGFVCPTGTTQQTASLCIADTNKIRSSVGVSFIWSSPFGPLRFDYAFPLSKESYDKTQAFRFGGGTAF